MPVAIESALLAEVVPEVLIGERKEKSNLDDDIKQLKKEACTTSASTALPKIILVI